MRKLRSFRWKFGFSPSRNLALSVNSASLSIWTLRTYHDTTLFYDPAKRLCMHAAEPREGWCTVHLWSNDRVHGLIIPDCARAAEHIRPVRIRFYNEMQCLLLSARCGLDERIYSAKPADDFESPGGFVEAGEQAGPWEVVTIVPAPERTGIHEKSLLAFSELLTEKPNPTTVMDRQTDALGLRWYLAFQEYMYLDTLGGEAIKQPGLGFMRGLAATATQPATRHAYESLADWIENRDENRPIGHLGYDFDVLEPWPRHAPFTIDFELIARMRQYIEPRKGACVLATLRNEGPYIVEWLAYHKSLGFEHFFIYTNDNSDGSDELLAALAAQGHVTLITNEVRNVRPQYKAYGHAFKALPHILDYEWALVIDADEFLVLAPNRKFSDVKHYIDWISTRPVDAIALNWLVFRTCGIERADLNKPVTCRFVQRADFVDQHIKSLVKPRYFVHSHAHHGFEIAGRPTRYLNSSGDVHLHEHEKAHSFHPVADAAWVNHYWTKSTQEFCGKLARKPGDMYSSYVRPLAEIDDMLKTMLQVEAREDAVEDRRIWSRLEAAEAIASQILADPRVRAAHEASIYDQRKHLDVLTKQLASDHGDRVAAQRATVDASEETEAGAS